MPTVSTLPLSCVSIISTTTGGNEKKNQSMKHCFDYIMSNTWYHKCCTYTRLSDGQNAPVYLSPYWWVLTKPPVSFCIIAESVTNQKPSDIPNDWWIWSNERPDSLINDMANSPVSLALYGARLRHKLATFN